MENGILLTTFLRGWRIQQEHFWSTGQFIVIKCTQFTEWIQQLKTINFEELKISKYEERSSSC